MGARIDGRKAGSLREIRLVRSCLRQTAGSALIRAGNTQILCAATIDDKPPSWLRGQNRGWVTAEYGMLPGSVRERRARNKVDGRGMEIQRLIGRSLRAVVKLEALGERTITLDCDVLEADGGTRTAAITAAWVALREAVDLLLAEGKIQEDPIVDTLAAVSVGVVDGKLLLDLCAAEDTRAEVDCNIVATGRGKLVEVQGTAERGTFTPAAMGRMVGLGLSGIRQLTKLQRDCAVRAPEPLGVLLPGAVSLPPRPTTPPAPPALPAAPAPTAARQAMRPTAPRPRGKRS